jgi:hypothetical protein
MFENLSCMDDIELVQHFESAELDRFGTVRVTAELQGFITSLLLIEEKYEYSYMIYLSEGHILS